jgi:ketosteroid isomerase-like protein
MTSSFTRGVVLVVGCAALVVTRPDVARPAPSNVATPQSFLSDSSDVVATVKRFHDALAAGDSSAALALLSPDALILESGAVETRAEYRAHHLPADIEFARAVPSSRTVARVTISGDAAWVTSTSITQGQAGGRQINSAGAELVVLRRVRGVWQIEAIHWSSRSRRAS